MAWFFVGMLLNGTTVVVIPIDLDQEPANKMMCEVMVAGAPKERYKWVECRQTTFDELMEELSK